MFEFDFDLMHKKSTRKHITLFDVGFALMHKKSKNTTFDFDFGLVIYL